VFHFCCLPTGLGELIHLKRNDLLISRNSESTMLYLIIDGSAIVELSPGRTKELIRGQFVGELSFITGALTSADVRAPVITRWF